jgi:hypothetical protein
VLWKEVKRMKITITLSRLQTMVAIDILDAIALGVHVEADVTIRQRLQEVVDKLEAALRTA